MDNVQFPLDNIFKDSLDLTNKKRRIHMNDVQFSLDDIFGDSLNLTLDEDKKNEEKIVIDSVPKLVKVREDGIVILDDTLMDDIKKKNLSASMISSFFQCPADWVMNSFLLPKMDYEEPVHLVRGKIFHSIMEKFFTLKKSQRNPKTLSQVAMNVVKENYKEQLNNLETMNWLKEALQGYLETGFDYANVNVAQIEKEKGQGAELGVEMFVRGKLGNTTREVVGFVDRIDDLGDGSLQVIDYKSGKKIHPFDPKEPINDRNDFGYWRQQLAYTMLLEQLGHKVSKAKLEFPIARGEVIVDVNNQALRKQVEHDFEVVDAALNKCIEENFFPFHGHMFCKWCGMLSPKFTPSKYGQLNISWEEINQYVELL